LCHYLHALLYQPMPLWFENSCNTLQVTNLGIITEASNQPLARDDARSYYLKDQAGAQPGRNCAVALCLVDLRFRFGHWSAIPRTECIVYIMSLTKKLWQRGINSAVARSLRSRDRKRDIKGSEALNIMIYLLKTCTVFE
jgi:hypothetical protein